MWEMPVIAGREEFWAMAGRVRDADSARAKTHFIVKASRERYQDSPGVEQSTSGRRVSRSCVTSNKSTDRMSRAPATGQDPIGANEEAARTSENNVSQPAARDAGAFCPGQPGLLDRRRN